MNFDQLFITRIFGDSKRSSTSNILDIDEGSMNGWKIDYKIMKINISNKINPA